MRLILKWTIIRLRTFAHLEEIEIKFQENDVE